LNVACKNRAETWKQGHLRWDCRGGTAPRRTGKAHGHPRAGAQAKACPGPRRVSDRTLPSPRGLAPRVDQAGLLARLHPSPGLPMQVHAQWRHPASSGLQQRGLRRNGWWHQRHRLPV